MTLDTAIYNLPMAPKLEDCQNLHAFLQDAVGTPVEVNCNAVTRLGGLAAQILCVAAKTWAAEGVPLRFADPSTECRDSLTMLGLDTLLNENEGDQ